MMPRAAGYLALFFQEQDKTDAPRRHAFSFCVFSYDKFTSLSLHTRVGLIALSQCV